MTFIEIIESKLVPPLLKIEEHHLDRKTHQFENQTVANNNIITRKEERMKSTWIVGPSPKGAEYGALLEHSLMCFLFSKRNIHSCMYA